MEGDLMEHNGVWTWEFTDPGLVPEVSIVICAHGKSEITLGCLQALNESLKMNLARAEVILVDDASPDDTVALTQGIRGLKLVALAVNVGFLRAANAGLAAASGKHVLFLNNDTEPIGCWLDPLLETLERRPNALVVGSKLVYPDGTLQEAGGIIFNDASGWNYGRGLDPFDPRVSFERQVDYVSGASLLARGDFLRQRGGFDERYAPAYYEDTDLCFAAREAGGEVWYQPSSIVVHYEGQSNGTDETSGIKAFQPINREKFYERWSKTLVGQRGPESASVSSARQRSLHGRILVIENQVPTPDRDSGSVRLTAVLKAMLDLGFAITFLPANGWRSEPYTRRLERLGIEVLGVTDEWWEHISEMAQEISHVWIARPEVAQKYLARARSMLPKAMIIYDTVDLHFLRLERESASTSDPGLRKAALHQQIQELDLMDLADASVVVSPHELDMLSDRTSARIALVPNIHQVLDREISLEGRRGIIFVGSFRHTPNVDAVVWFVREVLPLVVSKIPNVRMTIIGPDPTDSVLSLESENVRVTGWVVETEPHYEEARLAVAPLRFGAGVKGKVGEALTFGVPMVMTPIASEGMHLLHGQHALIAEDPAEFAKNVVALLHDDELWHKLSLAGRLLIGERFSVEVTREMVGNVLNLGKSDRVTTWA